MGGESLAAAPLAALAALLAALQAAGAPRSDRPAASRRLELGEWPGRSWSEAEGAGSE